MGASGEGLFQNRFNYMSGRWITIKGATAAPRKGDIKGWMVRTVLKMQPPCLSDSLQNWIYNTVKWTFENLSLGGYIGRLSPAERFGTEAMRMPPPNRTAQLQAGSILQQVAEDWRDVQGTEPMVGNMNDPAWARKQEGSGRILGGGILPQTAPTYHGGGGPAWGGIVVTLPWFLYHYYGDKQALEENFNMIRGCWLSGHAR